VSVVYSLCGGALFQALEGPYETRIKSRVNDSIDWHVKISIINAQVAETVITTYTCYNPMNNSLTKLTIDRLACFNDVERHQGTEHSASGNCIFLIIIGAGKT